MSGNAAARAPKAWLTLPGDASPNCLSQASRLAKRHHR
jgi:hypothetical protein